MDDIDDQPRRRWQTNSDDSQMRCYIGMKGRVSIGELVEHFAEKYPHVDPMSLDLNFSSATWEEPPTADDIAKREESRTWQAQRTERWERETYDRLKKKFERNAAEAGQ